MRPLGGERLYRGAALLPLRFAIPDFRDTFATDGHVQRAVAHRLAGDAVFFDQGIDHRRAIAELGEQAVAGGRTEGRDEIVGLDPHAGIDEANIAAGAAEADHLRLDHRRLHALFGEVQRCR
ncbi:hypothetical protein D9M70_476950 [compost metagenome]